MTTDLVIVGGGPAGSAAAIEASRAGLETVVIDKSTFPRDKCCGDGLTTSALRHLDDLGFDPAAVPSWRSIVDVRVRSPRGREVVFPLPRLDGRPAGGLFAAVARRSELDIAMLEMARQAGTTVFEGYELTTLSQSSHGVAIEAAGRQGLLSIEARYIIGADGMWSTTRKLAGIDTTGYRGDWHGFRQYFDGVTGAAARELLIWFEPDLLPGYVWAFPVDENSANVGFGIVRRAGISVQFMKERWLDVLQRPHIRDALGSTATPEAPHRAWPIPARLGDIPSVVGRTILVGDAAGATDPMTGEGIGQAIETGRLAATAIADAGFDRPTEAGRHYRSELERSMVRDHRLAGRLSSVLSKPRGADTAIAVAGASDWTRRNFARWLFEDYPRAALFTPHRWRRRLFTSRGAFTDHAEADAA